MEDVIVIRNTAAALEGGGETVIVRSKDRFGGFGVVTRKDILR